MIDKITGVMKKERFYSRRQGCTNGCFANLHAANVLGRQDYSNITFHWSYCYSSKNYAVNISN